MLCSELPVLKAECQALLSGKQELVDAARRLLGANTAALRSLEVRAGCAAPDDGGVAAAYERALAEWEDQMRAKHAAGAVLGDNSCCAPVGGIVFLVCQHASQCSILTELTATSIAHRCSESR